MSEVRTLLRQLRNQRRNHDRDLVDITEQQMNLETDFAFETMLTGDEGTLTGAGVAWLLQRRFDHLEEHALEIEERLRADFGIVQTRSQRYWSANQEARGDLYAALLGLTDDDLDDVPVDPPGEWPIRTTLEHTLDVEHSYRLSTRWAVDKFRAGEPFEVMPKVDRDRDRQLSIEALVEQLDEARETTLDELLDISDAELAAPTQWFGIDCDVRFRLMRFAQHEREHTAQIRKWRVQTGKPVSEAARYLGLCWQRNGRLEGILCGAPDEALDRVPGNANRTIREVLAHIGSAERYFKSKIDAALGT